MLKSFKNHVLIFALFFNVACGGGDSGGGTEATTTTTELKYGSVWFENQAKTIKTPGYGDYVYQVNLVSFADCERITNFHLTEDGTRPKFKITSNKQSGRFDVPHIYKMEGATITVVEDEEIEGKEWITFCKNDKNAVLKSKLKFSVKDTEYCNNTRNGQNCEIELALVDMIPLKNVTWNSTLKVVNAFSPDYKKWETDVVLSTTDLGSLPEFSKSVVLATVEVPLVSTTKNLRLDFQTIINVVDTDGSAYVTQHGKKLNGPSSTPFHVSYADTGSGVLLGYYSTQSTTFTPSNVDDFMEKETDGTYNYFKKEDIFNYAYSKMVSYEKQHSFLLKQNSKQVGEEIGSITVTNLAPAMYSLEAKKAFNIVFKLSNSTAQ